MQFGHTAALPGGENVADVYKRQGKNSPYIWLRCPGNMKSWEFFDWLLENCGVVGTPVSYTHLDVYKRQDEDYSGIDRNRPAFNAMIQAASEHKVDVVLAKTQSRDVYKRQMEHSLLRNDLD